jgi:MFS family permease
VTTPAPAATESPPLPPLGRDSSFWGMTATQFLGAFNDNLFKQLVLLIAAQYVIDRGLTSDPYQTVAQAIFSLPFVLFSGFAGWLSDRYSKRTIVVLSKAAEIVVMGAGLAVFGLVSWGSDLYLGGLLAVLFCMGAQSAFFGPAKYGILPEMLRDTDLPKANGIIQMTTFLAIIFGTAVCGALKDQLALQGGGLWPISAACVVLAVIGTATSLWVRRTRVADPGIPLTVESFAIHASTWRLLKEDRLLRGALAAMVLFWFLGGVSLPTVNALGKFQYGLSDTVTSILTAHVGLGIAIGCLIAGLLSRQRVNFGLVRWGSWGMLVSMALLCCVPRWFPQPVDPSAETGPMVEYIIAPLLALLGLSAGVFAVPIQVLLQSRPPAELKGRMIGTMNLVTWFGILASAGFYGACSGIFSNEQISWTFGVLAVLVLPIALFYHPQDQDLAET